MRLGILPILAAAGIAAADPPRVDFNRQIRPLLSDRCFRCHGFDASSRKADLRLDDRTEAVKSRPGATAIAPGKPDASEMIRRITSNDVDERMPPASSNKSLTAAEINLLKRWIAEGAAYETHWAFRRVERPVAPSVKSNGWRANPIDAFVLTRLEKAGLEPSAPADPVSLCRRLHLDIIGLPPTPEVVDAFVAACARPTDGKSAKLQPWLTLVDSLLASPHYGERWGRHWLDQARYADSNGYTVDGPRIMWPFRDWVIRAFNDDLPFDQFTIEQLAGDLLPQPTKSQLIATAFHRNSMMNQEGGVKADQFRHEAIVDRVNTTGAVWLGLTVGCAQCHTHKFDPITHTDYYRLYAFFNGCLDNNNPGPTVAVYPGEVFGLTTEQQATLATLIEKRKQLARLETTAKPKAKTKDAKKKTPTVKPPEGKPKSAPETPMQKALGSEIAALEAKLPGLGRPVQQTIIRDNENPWRTFRLERGDFLRPDKNLGLLPPGVPQSLGASLTTPMRNRLDLARWIVHRDNPLTARVVVNRVWQHYFGRGLVATENDFGYQGSPPTHPELLDWLAAEFMESGWSLKKLHRLIVTSATYRQSSAAKGKAAEVDPGNHSLARQTRFRVEAEIVRDLALAASGLLDRRIGGPSVFPPQPADVFSFTQTVKQWPESQGPDRYRRTMYTTFFRSAPYPLLATFDAPDFCNVCTSRVRSNTPLQSLTLANDPAMVEIARGLAVRALRDNPPSTTIDKPIERMFRLCLSRRPSDRELGLLVAFVDRESKRGIQDRQENLTGVARILFNLDEFVVRN